MATGYSAVLRLGKPEVGADESTWGTILNVNTIDMLDEAIGGYVSISVAGGNVTLSTANGTTDQARCAIIKFTGSPGANRTITAPDVEKTYWLVNGVGDTSSILFKATGGSTVTIPWGCTAKVYTDGATGAVILSLYGEGTFSTSPTITFGGAAVGMTYAANGQIGRWARKGRTVTIQIYILLTAKGSSTGSALVNNLPFNSTAATNGYCAFAVHGGALSSITGHLQMYLAPSGNSLNITYLGTGSTSALSEANFGNTSELIINGSYEAV